MSTQTQTQTQTNSQQQIPASLHSTGKAGNPQADIAGATGGSNPGVGGNPGNKPTGGNPGGNPSGNPVAILTEILNFDPNSLISKELYLLMIHLKMILNQVHQREQNFTCKGLLNLTMVTNLTLQFQMLRSFWII